MGIVRYTVANGQLPAASRDGVAKRYVGDPLGSTAALVDTTGAITDTFTYWPYGEERIRTGTTPTPFRYVGTLGYYRDDAGRSYVRARALAPTRGRWLTNDPRRHGGNDPWYANANPTTAVDPSGLDSKKPKVCYDEDACKKAKISCDTQTTGSGMGNRIYWERICAKDPRNPLGGARDCGCCNKGEFVRPCEGHGKRMQEKFVCGGGAAPPADPKKDPFNPLKDLIGIGKGAVDFYKGFIGLL